MSGRPKQSAADEEASRREQIAEARGLAKDLNGLLRQARELKANLIREVEETAAKTAMAEMERFINHLQKQMNHSSTELNEGIARAREHILKSLTLARLVPDNRDGDRGLKFVFEANGHFDDDVPPPAPDVADGMPLPDLEFEHVDEDVPGDTPES